MGLILVLLLVKLMIQFEIWTKSAIICIALGLQVHHNETYLKCCLRHGKIRVSPKTPFYIQSRFYSRHLSQLPNVQATHLVQVGIYKTKFQSNSIFSCPSHILDFFTLLQSLLSQYSSHFHALKNLKLILEG